MNDEDWKTKLNRMEMCDTNYVAIENDEKDMKEHKEILRTLRTTNSRFKMAEKVENSDGKLEPCNGVHYVVRLEYINDRTIVKYFQDKKIAQEFNRRYLKRQKNRKGGFAVLVPNG